MRTIISNIVFAQRVVTTECHGLVRISTMLYALW